MPVQVDLRIRVVLMDVHEHDPRARIYAMLSFCCELEAIELVVMSPHTRRVE